MTADTLATDHVAASEVRWDRRTWLAVAALASATFALVFAEFLPAGLLTPMAADLGITEGTAGQVVTATAVVGAIAALLTNLLIGRLDRKLVLIGLTALAVLSNLVAAFGTEFWIILVGRAGLGIALSGFWALASAVVARLVGMSSFGRGMSFIFVGVSLATIAAPSAGAVLSDTFGWRAAMLAAAGAALLSVIMQFVCLPRLPATKGNSIGGLVALLRNPSIVLGMLAIVLLAGGHFAGFVYVRPYLEQITLLPATLVAATLLGYGLASVVGNVVGGRLADANVRIALIAVSALLTLATFGLSLWGSNPTVAIGLVALWGLAFGGTPIALQTNLSRAALDQLEAAGSLMVVCFQVAIAAGAVVGGAIVDGIGVPYAPALSGGMAALALILALFRRS
jgi:MFS transporter, DHA1 family, purine ribonucleoside efflux pump